MPIDVQSSQDFGGARRILNLPAPGGPAEPVRLQDLNAAIEGLAWKDNARVAASTNITLASPGSTLDGIAMSVNDRVLLKAQTNAADNGIYIWNGAATPMTRALDASTSEELESAVLTIDEGTSAGASFRQTLVNFVLGTGTPAFVTFGTSAAPASETVAGIAEVATQGEVDGLTDNQRFITPLTLANWSGRSKKVEQVVGDGTSTSITVTHNLNSRGVQIEVYRNSGNYDTVLVETRRISVNAIQLIFDQAPAANAYAVVVRV